MNLDDNIKPSLPITVPLELHDAMADATSKEFAISYLCGALVSDGLLLPRTDIAKERLLASPEACRVLNAHGLHIGRSQRRDERTPIPAVTKLIEHHNLTGKWHSTKAGLT